MILLGIDTCGAMGTLALARVNAGGKLALLGSAELAGRSAAAMLVPALGQILRDAGVSMGEIAGLVVVDGPGSFTGIRIGLSTAKALAEAGSLPLYAISRLRVLASLHQIPWAALDAGRGEFYCIGRMAGDESFAGSPLEAGVEASTEEWLLTGAELAAHLAAQPDSAREVAVCEPKVAAALAEAGLTVRLVDSPTAAGALRAALPGVLASQYCDVAELDGRYLRRPDLYRTAQPLAR